jgi:hypothetical protein
MMAALLLAFGVSGRGALEAPPSAEATETTTEFFYGNNPDGTIGPIAANGGASEVLLSSAISPWCTDCYITRIVPDMVYWDDPNPALTNGTPANYNADNGQGIWLHHDNILSNCGFPAPRTVFLSGNERTVYQAPPGYGSYVGVPGSPDDPDFCNINWYVGWHIHNSGNQPHKVKVKFTVTYVTGVTLNRLKGIGLSIATATDAEYTIPTGYSDTHTGDANPPGQIRPDFVITSEQQGQIIGAGGHVHDYGYGVSAFNLTRGVWLCTSTAGYGSGSRYLPVGGPGTPGHPAAANSQTLDHDYHLPSTPDNAYHIQHMALCTPTARGSILCTGDVIRLHSSYNNTSGFPIPDAMGILSLSLPATPPNADAASEGSNPIWDGCDAGDSDGDQFSDQIEAPVGTLANDPCGTNAWPPDINNNGNVGVIDDLGAVAGDAFETVPPAPARHDIAPDPPDGTIDVINDLGRVAGLAFDTCTP